MRVFARMHAVVPARMLARMFAVTAACRVSRRMPMPRSVSARHAARMTGGLSTGVPVRRMSPGMAFVLSTMFRVCARCFFFHQVDP